MSEIELRRDENDMVVGKEEKWAGLRDSYTLGERHRHEADFRTTVHIEMQLQ
jgi:hypothetical protein